MSENEVVTPAGAPDIDRVTAELKPLRDVTVTVELPASPCCTEIGLEVDMEKSGEGWGAGAPTAALYAA